MRFSQYQSDARRRQSQGVHWLHAINIYRFAFLSLACLLLGNAVGAQNGAAKDFSVRPYLQLGDNAKLSQLDTLNVIWLTATDSDKWQLYVKHKGDDHWQEEKAPACASVLTPAKMYRLQGQITHLQPGTLFQYRLLKNGKQVFQASALARQSAQQPCRFALFGDMGANTDSQRKVAYQVFQKKPDALIALGDIVYDFGLFSEYLEKFFPIYNNEKSSPQTGAPLLQSTVSVACVGNHDVALSGYSTGVNFDKYQDALAYFNVWSQPLNGPLTDGQAGNVAKLAGSQENVSKFLTQAGVKYPRMANFSFDYGNAHWLILDANPYMDWTNPALRNWVVNDLASAAGCQWKFVCFHQPGFSFDISHYKEQRMRLLCDIFEKAGVDVVFSGHAHNYQRTFPLFFNIKRENGKPQINQDGTIDGEFRLDKSFDGIKNTSPQGVLYIVSGAGGAKLYPSVKDSMPWVDAVFTNKFISDVHSFTLCDLAGSQLNLSEISENGTVLDHLTIKKKAASGGRQQSQASFASTSSTRSAK